MYEITKTIQLFDLLELQHLFPLWLNVLISCAIGFLLSVCYRSIVSSAWVSTYFCNSEGLPERVSGFARLCFCWWTPDFSWRSQGKLRSDGFWPIFTLDLFCVSLHCWFWVSRISIENKQSIKWTGPFRFLFIFNFYVVVIETKI